MLKPFKWGAIGFAIVDLASGEDEIPLGVRTLGLWVVSWDDVFNFVRFDFGLRDGFASIQADAALELPEFVFEDALTTGKFEFLHFLSSLGVEFFIFVLDFLYFFLGFFAEKVFADKLQSDEVGFAVFF